MFDRVEADLLFGTVKSDLRITDNAMGWPDGKGGLSKITLWNHPGDNIYGVIARSERIVESVTRLVGDEVYHYHSKLMLKEPESRRRLGLASGLWLLVPKRLSIPDDGELLHRRRPGGS